MELDGKVAVVTGAASGIGRGIARRMAANGAHLALADIDEEQLVAVCEDIASRGGEALPVVTDVADPAQVDALAATTIDRYGAVHVVCNNAGIGPIASIDETSTELWARTLAINLWGPIHGVRTFLPILREQGEGHLNATASESALYAVPFLAAYNVAKNGVVGLMATVARELRATDSPVTASVLCPGTVSTNIVANAGMDDGVSEATLQIRRNVDDAVAAGMDPDEVGDRVIDGILEGRFWIFTHDRVPAAALAQAEAMAADGSLSELV